MNSANRVIFNSGILYARMLITVGISLYSTRLILLNLGATDFGIYNLILGVVSMLAFLNNAMSVSTQRYLSFYQGKADITEQKSVFKNSLFLHLIIGAFIIISLEIIGALYFDSMLNIPISRYDVAKNIFHVLTISILASILTSPFNGLINSHEKFYFVALVNILETILKFLVALSLPYINMDKLLFFGIGTVTINFLTFILYVTYCQFNFNECTFRIWSGIKTSRLKELSSFTGWNLFGSLTSLGKTQGLAVVFNNFFGTKINASYGIANQISNQLNFFSSTMLRALNPQIMKSEGEDDRDRMIRLSLIASKYGFFLLAIFAVPFIFEMPKILHLWLVIVPPDSIMLCRLILIAFLINQLTIGLDSAVQALGKLKYYMLSVGLIKLLIVPLGFTILKLGYPLFAVMYGYILLEFFGGIARVFVMKKMIHLSFRKYFDEVILKSLIPITITVIINVFIFRYLDTDFRFVFLSISSVSSFILSFYFFSMSKQEKVIIENLKKKFLTWKRND